MRKLLSYLSIFFGVVLFITITNVNAKTALLDSPGIIELQLQTEQWVKTTTAQVTVSADITADKNGGLTQTREQLLTKFANLAENAVWHITTFNTSQSESGLEQIHVEAQARLPENSLGNLREKATSLSKPGLTLRIFSIDFTPSLEELEMAKANLRSVIYNEAKQEMARVNKIYPEQNYALSSIAFATVYPLPIPPGVLSARAVGANGSGGNVLTRTAVFSVSTKVHLSATIDLSPTTSKEILKEIKPEKNSQ